METTEKDKICYVYHICRGSDIFNYSCGYIGVSFYPQKRLNFHKNRSENPHLKNAFSTYNDIIMYCIMCSKESDFCYTFEMLLRPYKNMGWNINVGGIQPPNPKGTKNCISNLPAHKRRKNFKHSEDTKEYLKFL